MRGLKNNISKKEVKLVNREVKRNKMSRKTFWLTVLIVLLIIGVIALLLYLKFKGVNANVTLDIDLHKDPPLVRWFKSLFNLD